MGLDTNTVFRFVHTHEKPGYLLRDPEPKRNRSGLKVLRLGFAALTSLGLPQIAQPYLRPLSRLTDEPTSMTVLDGREIVHIARNATQQIIIINLQLGSRLPAYHTSMGKAQVMDKPRSELSDLLDQGPYPATGPTTVTSPDAQVAELEKVREKGYAINDEELVAGCRSVAAPVRENEGKIVAAINVSVPVARVSRPELEVGLALRVMNTACEISLALGAGL